MPKRTEPPFAPGQEVITIFAGKIHAITYKLDGETHKVTVDGPGKEVLHGWAEACHVEWPSATICVQSDNPGWAINVPDLTNPDDVEGMWIPCTIEPPMACPKAYRDYYGHGIEGLI